MKKLLHFLFLFILLLTLGSCHSIKVMTDYDPSVSFDTYKTYAFYKKGIDQVQISDLDKRRILKALENTLQAKCFTPSENPQILINIFTKESAKVDVFNNNTFGGAWGMGWGWGWNPWMWPGMGMRNTTVSTYAQGSLYIDFIDANTKRLLWQGSGEGVLKPQSEPMKKQEVIQKFVDEILSQYPPQKK